MNSKAFTPKKGRPTLSRHASNELRRAGVQAMRDAGEVIRIGGYGTISPAQDTNDFDLTGQREMWDAEEREATNPEPKPDFVPATGWPKELINECEGHDALPLPLIFEVQRKGENGKYSGVVLCVSAEDAKKDAKASAAREGVDYRVFNTETGKPVGKPYKG